MRFERDGRQDAGRWSWLAHPLTVVILFAIVLMRDIGPGNPRDVDA